MHLPVRLSIPGRKHVKAIGFIESFVPGEVSLFLNCLLADHTPVTVEFKGAHLEGEIVSSLPLNGGYKTNILVYDDSEAGGQRRAPRFPVILPAQVYGCGSNVPLKATIVDISREGLGLDIRERLDIDTTIAVETESCTAFGVVRHCRPLARDRFRAGVSMVYVMHKAPKRFWHSWLNRRTA